MEAQRLNDDLTPPELNIYSGDWNVYEEALFKIFQRDLLGAKLTFQGIPVKFKRHPEYKGKHFVFWHLISEGEREEERTPDLRRCERLSWINWVIRKCEGHPGIYYWDNKRKSQTHTVIWYEKENYAIILAKRKDYFLLKTAYLLSLRRSKQFTQERDQFSKKKP